MRPRSGILLPLLMLGALVSTADARQRRPWSGGFHYTYSHDGPNIVLGYVRQDEDHLSGEFTFENISGKRAQAKTVVLQGTKTEDGHFWPRVRYEARRDDNAPWEPLGDSSTIGRSATLTVKADSKPADLWVRLDVFQPLIGSHQTGRIVLSSGDTSQFQLKDLAPPDER